MRRRVLFLLVSACLMATSAMADRLWINDLRTLFLNNSAIVLEVNPRSYFAIDKDGDGLISKKDGDISGNFLNSIERLKATPTFGVNTLILMPINEVGKVKALGTAGSLYATADFSKLNKQLVSKDTILSDIEQAKKFISEAHNNNLRIIVDLPACGAYDLFLKRPELFLKGANGDGVIPENWTDVRLFDAGSEISYNKDLFNVYKEFIDLMHEIGVDGIRACEPQMKPASFWHDLIEYSRRNDPQVLWIAQAGDKTKMVKNSPINTPTEKLLEAGFDGYYGNLQSIKRYNSGDEVINEIKAIEQFKKKYSNQKAILGVFDTHDDPSPMLEKGIQYLYQQYWLGATLPVNSFIVDGNQNGDNFIYKYANKKADVTETDDNTYFVNRGKMDIYNYTRIPFGGDFDLYDAYATTNFVKRYFANTLSLGKFKVLKTNNPNIFAYSYSYNRMALVVFGNASPLSYAQGFVKVPKITKEVSSMPVKITNSPVIEKGKISVNLQSREIQVIVINDFDI